MRILVLTNFYPPHSLGGQEQSCQQVVEGLKSRGHQILVLTSKYGLDNGGGIDNDICRCFYLEMDFSPILSAVNFFLFRRRREKYNLAQLEIYLNRFNPDVVFIWGMWNLPRSLPALAEEMCSGKIVYRFADYWPTLPNQYQLYWQDLGRYWYTRLPKKLLAPLAMKALKKENSRPVLKFKNAFCVSRTTKEKLVEAGIPISQAEVIYTGIDLTNFSGVAPRRNDDSKQSLVRLLYVGRLSPEKGVETVIRAMDFLINDSCFDQISLDLIGAGSPEYVLQLQRAVSHAGLEKYVSFLGQIPYDSMPSMMQEHDILIFPSIWDEPFARVILEGMISGLAVLATPTGGTSEIVIDEENGLLFTPRDANDLAQKIIRLVSDPILRDRFITEGRRVVEEKFTFSVMIDKIEGYLSDVYEASN